MSVENHGMNNHHGSRWLDCDTYRGGNSIEFCPTVILFDHRNWKKKSSRSPQLFSGFLEGGTPSNEKVTLQKLSIDTSSVCVDRSRAQTLAPDNRKSKVPSVFPEEEGSRVAQEERFRAVLPGRRRGLEAPGLTRLASIGAWVREGLSSWFQKGRLLKSPITLPRKAFDPVLGPVWPYMFPTK